MRIIILILLCFMTVTVAVGEEMKSITLPDLKTDLKEGEGLEAVKTHCNTCHSLDYITMQPGFSVQQWTGIVNKMRKVFGAPISDIDTEVIIKYLSINFGR